MNLLSDRHLLGHLGLGRRTRTGDARPGARLLLEDLPELEGLVRRYWVG